MLKRNRIVFPQRDGQILIPGTCDMTLFENNISADVTELRPSWTRMHPHLMTGVSWEEATWDDDTRKTVCDDRTEV